MRYQTRFAISIPIDALDIARKISRAMDPDQGGALSYSPRYAADAEYVIDVDGVITYTSEPLCWVADTPCRPEFLAQATYLISHPAALHAAVSADYAARWPGLTPPTLAECHAFCAGAVLTTAPPPIN